MAERVICPICKLEGLDKEMLGLHLPFCRKKNRSTGPMYECPFNAMHLVPIHEKTFHQLHCPDKQPMALDVGHGQLVELSLEDIDPKKADEMNKGGIGGSKSDCIATFNAMPRLQYCRLVGPKKHQRPK